MEFTSLAVEVEKLLPDNPGAAALLIAAHEKSFGKDDNNPLLARLKAMIAPSQPSFQILDSTGRERLNEIRVAGTDQNQPLSGSWAIRLDKPIREGEVVTVIVSVEEGATVRLNSSAPSGEANSDKKPAPTRTLELKFGATADGGRHVWHDPFILVVEVNAANLTSASVVSHQLLSSDPAFTPGTRRVPITPAK